MVNFIFKFVNALIFDILWILYLILSYQIVTLCKAYLCCYISMPTLHMIKIIKITNCYIHILELFWDYQAFWSAQVAELRPAAVPHLHHQNTTHANLTTTEQSLYGLGSSSQNNNNSHQTTCRHRPHILPSKAVLDPVRWLFPRRAGKSDLQPKRELRYPHLRLIIIWMILTTIAM